MTTHPYRSRMARLPDPVTRPGFYANIRAKRLIAWVIDMTITGVASALLLPFTAFAALFFFPVFMLATGFVYRWFTLAAGSATWGMALMAVQIRAADGGRLTSQQALLHTLGYTLSVAVAPLQLLSIGLMCLSPRRQGLTDLLMGTAMINRPGASTGR